ncbi:hypothetical protein Forpe1208_v000122 [Fusarium oxysporum f. sp. rapae]|uniref:Uncharacterized protein n=1 Tax=Fusarium oxysporum f. sp. rapae TaxID=485398 RepID=A0A8J5PLB0_FUSOX|nr:hypothetical protein Forpe1208_v000122 [Fusarium oxysporum f. sp. rapae]
MESPDEAPYFCMADTRCRLCQFELEEGDLVIAHIGGQRFSMEFNLRMAETIHDSYEWINLHTCASPRCMAEGRRIPFFHNDCFCFRLYDISDALVAAGDYAFDPPAYERNRRSHRIKRLLAPKLRDELQIRLPAETLMAIAGLLVRECAVITAEEQSRGVNVSDMTVDLTQDVYISYTTVDGVRYVKSIGNTLSKFCNEDHPGLLSKQGEPVDMDAAYPRGFFIHMPLDDGEFVTEICRRYALAAGNRISACLVFVTNKGRSTLFGTSGPPESCLVLDKILTPAPNGTQIWFNDSTSVHPKSLRYLAFDGLMPPVQRPFPPSLIPNPPYFWTQNTESWFVSSCSMEGIVDMTLCRDTAFDHRPITGILLQYENGHRECLGQFQFDKALKTVRVEHTMDLYIGSLRTTCSYLYIADIATSPLHDFGGLAWMRVSRHGTLEWWSSLRHSIVCYTSTTGQFTNLET